MRRRRSRPKDTRAHFLGNWRVVKIGKRGRDYADLLGPALIRFDDYGEGDFRLVGVAGDIDCRYSLEGQPPRVDFSWQGDDDTHDESGRGWAECKDGQLRGEILFHRGSTDTFVARRAPPEKKRILKRARDHEHDEY